MKDRGSGRRGTVEDDRPRLAGWRCLSSCKRPAWVPVISLVSHSGARHAKCTCRSFANSPPCPWEGASIDQLNRTGKNTWLACLVNTVTELRNVLRKGLRPIAQNQGSSSVLFLKRIRTYLFRVYTRTLDFRSTQGCTLPCDFAHSKVRLR